MNTIRGVWMPLLIVVLVLAMVVPALAADYTVTTAGDTVYNQDYSESGVYGAKPAYVADSGGGNECWLYHATESGVPFSTSWVLARTKVSLSDLDVYPYWYGIGAEATPPLGTYQPGSGAGPGAEVAEAAAAGGVSDKITNRTNVRMVFTGCNPRMLF